MEVHTLITGYIGSVNSVVFSPDGTKIAAIRDFINSYIVVFDLKTGLRVQDIKVFELPPLGRQWPSFLPTEHTRSPDNMIFSPDSKTIATTSTDGTIRFWDVENGEHLKVFTEGTDGVYSVVFSPDGKRIASANADESIRIWDVESGTVLKVLTAHTDTVRGVAFNPNGDTLASSSEDGTILLWDVFSGTVRRTLTGHKSWVNDVAFSADGSTLASSSSDGTILLWDIALTMLSNTIVSLTPANVEVADVGEQFTLSLSIVGGQNVAGYQATVHYDTTALRYVGSANGDFLPATSFTVPPIIDGNTVEIGAVAYAQEIDEDGTLATITFEVVAVKDSTVRLSNVLLTDRSGVREVPQIAFAEISEPPDIPEDVNDDGVVDITDLTLVASNFGKAGGDAANVNGDGFVNIVDLALIAAAIGNADAAAPALWSINRMICQHGQRSPYG